MGSMVSVIATGLFIYIIYNAYTKESNSLCPRVPSSGRPGGEVSYSENKNEVKSNPWSISSYFVDSDKTDATPFATNLEFSVVSPTPTHAYDVLPILTDNKPISRIN